MKKLTYFAVFCVFIANIGVYSQSRPFIGYDKVAWGSSIENVRRAYGIGNDIQAITDKEDSNLVTLTQPPVSSIGRVFVFNGGKLYRVWVTYGDEKASMTDKNQEELLRQLKNAIIQRYGSQTGTDYQTW